ncbi:MAG TPA: DUF3857 domain-containing protein [Flavipsychrobacter sp.]|nr:DUF3857 domain-containing protein [Flavipsychrobacter sp.]
MKPVLSFVLLLSISFLCTAREKKHLSVDSINEEMRMNANAVLRFSEREITIKSSTDIVIKVQYAITILNKKGLMSSIFQEGSSSLFTLKKLEGRLLDSTGKEIKKTTSDEFATSTTSAIAGFYDDAVVKYHVFNYPKFPYTILYSYEIHQNHSFVLPPWYVEDKPGVSVQKSSLSIVANGITLRHKSINLSDPIVDKDGSKMLYRWTVSNLPATIKEDSVDYTFLKDEKKVLLSMEDFQLQNYKGSVASWKSIGQFFYELNKERDVLPEQLRNKVNQLCNGKSEEEKIRILYNYLQENTRYVSVQYGISGWQTFDAAYVAQNNYGDCKALTNFMMAMLKEAGIKSYPVLVKAGSLVSNIVVNFPTPQFNHVILCVPRPNDTIWLECTSNDLPFNYLSSFTSCRTGLMITPEGGYLLNTPDYDTTYNKTLRTVKASIAADNSLSVVYYTKYFGEFAYLIGKQVENKKPNEIHKLANQRITLKSFDLIQSNYFKCSGNQTSPCMYETLSINAKALITEAGTMKIINANLAPFNPHVDEFFMERKTPFYMIESMTIVDTFYIFLPTDASIVALPEKISMIFPFGIFTCMVEKKDNYLFVRRKISVVKGKYESAFFSKYREFAEAIQSDKYYRVAIKSKS